MTEVNSTITLRLSSVKGATFKQTEDLLRRMLRESAIRQNAAVKANLSVDCTGRAKFSNTAARNLILPIPATEDRLEKFNVAAMDRSEVYRILGGYQKRLALAKFLHSSKWLATFEDCKIALGWVDHNLYKNVLRARKLPTAPRVKSAIIVLSKSATQFAKLSLTDRSITLENFALWNRRADLMFEIPEKIANLHPNLSKITRPNIRLLDKEIVFDFVLRENVEQEQVISNSALALDLGVSKAFSAVRVYSDGRYSEEFITSVFTDRHSKAVTKLSSEIKLISEKNRRRSLLGVVNSCAILQEKTLREKRIRINEAQDWSAAADILSHSNSGEQIIIENLKFNSGGNLGAKRFRHSSISGKLEHAANRLGKNVKRVSASYSSQTCPKCQNRITPAADRISRCECGWTADRDYTAAIVLGQRGIKITKLSVKKNQPTPKKPRRTARKRAVLPFKDTAWTAFTGATPAEATGNLLKISATSVSGVLPFSCSSSLIA